MVLGAFRHDSPDGRGQVKIKSDEFNSSLPLLSTRARIESTRGLECGSHFGINIYPNNSARVLLGTACLGRAGRAVGTGPELGHYLKLKNRQKQVRRAGKPTKILRIICQWLLKALRHFIK